MTEYRLSLTPRLIALAFFFGVALLILLFTLGFQIGQRMDRPQAAPAAVLRLEERAGAAARQAGGALDAAAEPLKAVPKALP